MATEPDFDPDEQIEDDSPDEDPGGEGHEGGEEGEGDADYPDARDADGEYDDDEDES